MKHYIFRIFTLYVLLFIISCNKTNEIPNTFHSYEEVEKILESGNFKENETTDTSNSSWITLARWQSEDGKNGFLTLGIRGEEYYFQNVPKDVWIGFKEAESKGKYYNSVIKGNYKIRLK